MSGIKACLPAELVKESAACVTRDMFLQRSYEVQKSNIFLVIIRSHLSIRDNLPVNLKGKLNLACDSIQPKQCQTYLYQLLCETEGTVASSSSLDRTSSFRNMQAAAFAMLQIVQKRKY